MSRKVVALDRLLALLVGLALVAAGAAGVLWWSGRFPAWPQSIEIDPVTDAAQQGWWPWAVGAAGILLLLVGLRWLGAHLPDRGVNRVTLAGSDERGRLLAEVRPVAHTAADVLARTEGVRSASGAILRDRGQLLARFTVTVEPQADLEAVARAADQVSSELSQVLERDDLRCQVNLKVARRGRALSRVD